MTDRDALLSYGFTLDKGKGWYQLRTKTGALVTMIPLSKDGLTISQGFLWIDNIVYANVTIKKQEDIHTLMNVLGVPMLRQFESVFRSVVV